MALETFGTNPELFEERAEMLKALAHPVRLCIVRGLVEKGASNVTNMYNCLNMPQSTISQHISKLKSSGIIKGTRSGLEISYEVTNPLVIEIINALFGE